MPTNYDLDLQSYFTDMEHLRGLFRQYVSEPALPKRLIVLHGVGGVGKSSLLRMFRLHCRNQNVPVALASGDEAKSTLDVITRWTEDLKEVGIKFPAFSKTLDSYRAIQAKVDVEAKKTSGQMASKAAGTVVSTFAAMIPGIGPLVGPLGGMGAEALADWLRGFLTKPDIDMLLDPAKKLSNDFIEDLAKAAEKKRMVLLLDTFEQMSALEDWVGETAQKIHPNVLIVIAGRKLPDWIRVWSGWMMNAQVEELKPMTEEIMRALIRRYYATMQGGEPPSVQVDNIVRFACGLPMVVTSAVQLWVKYGVEDFQSVKPEIIANLVDRLMEGVPSSLIPAIETAAVVRWFDQPILRAILNNEDVRDVYNELRRFPFVRTRVEGLVLHDSVREMMDENLRVQDPDRHAELHERAALYFEKRLERVTGEETERLGLERLFHRICVDEETGIKLFQEMAENLTYYRFIGNLRTLINDVNSYQLKKGASKNWYLYYTARLIQLDSRPNEGKFLQMAEDIYQKIAKNPDAETKTRSYALCDLGGILVRTVRLNETNGIPRAMKILEDAQRIIASNDRKAFDILSHMQDIYDFQSDWSQVERIISLRIDLSQKNSSFDELIAALISLIGEHADRGHWRHAFEAEKKLEDAIQGRTISRYLQQKFLKEKLHWIGSGRIHDSENQVLQALELARILKMRKHEAFCLSTLGYIYCLEDKNIALEAFGKSKVCLENIDSAWQLPMLYGYWGLALLRNGDFAGAAEKLTLSLKGKIKTSPKDINLILNWIAWLHEVEFTRDSTKPYLELAETNYKQSLDYRWTGRDDLIATALTGLVRVKQQQRDFAAIPPLFTEAEQLAQQYEYNDHLASLRLTQGHLAWVNKKQDEAVAYYQKAMIYALRYNRFLLDELLSGRPQGTPLSPIIPACLERGKKGQKMLQALLEWWKTGTNDIGTSRPNTISPIPEGIPLLKAEKLAREREPGDGSMQRSVIEQIDAAI